MGYYRGFLTSRTVPINDGKMRNSGYSWFREYPSTPWFHGVFSYFSSRKCHIGVEHCFSPFGKTPVQGRLICHKYAGIQLGLAARKGMF